MKMKMFFAIFYVHDLKDGGKFWSKIKEFFCEITALEY
jgi:hypothetical protein